MAFDKTPMSGLKFSLGQTIPLNLKRSYTADAYNAKAESIDSKAKDDLRGLQLEFWDTLIQLKKLKRDQKIYKENLNWLNKMIKISRKLYSNGKITQSTLFGLNIRKSEIKSSIVKVKYKLRAMQSHLIHFVHKEFKVIEKSIPWKNFRQKN